MVNCLGLDSYFISLLKYKMTFTGKVPMGKKYGTKFCRQRKNFEICG